MGIGQPGVHRPHRHLHRERGEEGEEQPELRFLGEIGAAQHADVCRAREIHHPQHGDQHQHRAEQRVEEEFVRRIDAPRAAPDADNQEHRDQAAFEEQIEQEHVARRERSDHQRFHQQEGYHIFRHALFHRDPAGEDAQRHQEHRKLDQHQRNAVDAQRPIKERREQRQILGELEGRGRLVELRPQPDAEAEFHQRGGEGHDTGAAGAFCVCAGQRRHHQGCHHRQQDHERKDHQRIIQAAAAARPTSITSA